METYSYHFPTQVIVEQNGIEKLPKLVDPYGNKALIITSRQTAISTNIITNIADNLKRNSINVLIYDDITPESDSATVDEIAILAKSSRCEFVIGIGGDLVLNIAKAVSLVCTNPGSATDYLTEQRGYRLKITRHPLSCILIPTAFATLCETMPGFILKDNEDGMKKKLYSRAVSPTLTLLDANLTGDISRKYMAASGLLLLGYAVDLLVSNRSNSISEMFALHTLDILRTTLPPLVRDPDNIELRGKLMNASLLISNGASMSMLGAIFALSEAASVVFDGYKGSVAAVMLPQFMEYNLTSASSQYVFIAKQLGEDTTDISVLEAAIKAVERVRIFVEEFNLPTRLSDLGMSDFDTDSIWTNFSRFEEANAIPRAISNDDLGTLIEQAT